MHVDAFVYMLKLHGMGSITKEPFPSRAWGKHAQSYTINQWAVMPSNPGRSGFGTFAVVGLQESAELCVQHTVMLSSATTKLGAIQPSIHALTQGGGGSPVNFGHYPTGNSGRLRLITFTID